MASARGDALSVVLFRYIIDAGGSDSLADALGSLISGNRHTVPGDDDDTQDTADTTEDESDNTARSETRAS